ncbi:MAG TPA: dihydrofolate reductase family protein [Streptosporangiaceae bacterium]|jgi:dihydrofolate reductase
MTQSTNRRVVANISLSLDGRVNGRDGEFDMSWIVPHAISDAARDHMIEVTGRAGTVLLGRKNYEGFGGYWPNVAKDETADPRDRAMAQWLDAVEKVVFSSTLTAAEWQNSRIVDADPGTVIKELRSGGEGDIIVLASASVIRQLLRADEVDRLSITLCPEIVGGGARLLDDQAPGSSWTAISTDTTGITESGAICLIFDRKRS